MTLAEWMAEKGKKDQDIAPLIERDRSMVSRFRRGEQLPTADLMERFAEITGGQVLPNDWFPKLTEQAA